MSRNSGMALEPTFEPESTKPTSKLPQTIGHAADAQARTREASRGLVAQRTSIDAGRTLACEFGFTG